MGSVSFSIDWQMLPVILVFGFLCFYLYGLKNKLPFPKIYFSDLEEFAGTKKSWRTYLAYLPQQMQWAALLFFLAAFLDPRFYLERKQGEQGFPPSNNFATEGIAIYLVLDQSGSMVEEVNALGPDGRPIRLSKVNLLKKVTSLFVMGDPGLGLSGRPNDLLGLVEFARGAHVIVPLTLDHQAVLEQLKSFDIVKDKDQDGTAIGYAIFKTANLIAATRSYSQELAGQGKPAYEIKNSVILLVTDGLQDPNPLDNGKRWRQIDPMEAAQYAKDNNIRLYIVNVEPKLAVEEFAANRRQMSKAAALTGGKFYMVDTYTNLASIYSEIDQLEKSKIPFQQELIDKLQSKLSKDDLPQFFERISLYPYLIGIALMCVFIGTMMEATLLRRSP